MGFHPGPLTMMPPWPAPTPWSARAGWRGPRSSSIQRELGHADPSTTAIYADVLDSARTAAADAADGWLKPQS